MRNLYFTVVFFTLFLFKVHLSIAVTPITGAIQAGTSTGITVSWGETDVNLSSSAVSLNRYQISYNEVGQTPTVIDNISNTLRSYTITGLSYGKTYEVRVIEVIRVLLPPSPFTPPFIETFTPSSDRTVTLVSPNQPPVARCQNITKSAGSSCTATIIATEVNNGSSDPENGTLSYSLNTTGPFAIGTHSVILTVTDPGGLTSTCTATVTVVDTTPPTISADDLTIELDDTGSAKLTINQLRVHTSDNCGVVNYSYDKTAFDCSNLGTNTLNFTAYDAAGNQGFGSATVTVLDKVQPFIGTGDIQLSLSTNGFATLSEERIRSTVSDNCGVASIAISKTTFSCEDIGNNSVELEVKDASGNTSKKTIVVTISDTTPPTVYLKDVTLVLDDAGKAELPVNAINNGSLDNCGVTDIILSKSAFDCGDIGQHQIAVYVKDAAGNEAVGQATVTVVDTTLPVVRTQDVVVYLDSTGTAKLELSQVAVSISDNCGTANVSYDPARYDCSTLGEQDVTVRAVDAAGNVGFSIAKVTVKDTIAPLVMVRDTILFADTSGNATLLAKDVNANASDVCGIDSVHSSKTIFTCQDTLSRVVFTAFDKSKNAAIDTFMVSVKDTILPVIKLTPITLFLDQSGRATLSVNDLDDGTTDNCQLDSMYVSKNDFDCSDETQQQVEFFAVDISGNTARQFVQVTIRDTLSPIIKAESVTLALGANGTATLTTNAVDNGTTDNCLITEQSFSRTNFSCDDIGSQAVLYTVTDASGNVSTATVMVEVQDLTPPDLTLQALTLTLNEQGTATLNQSQLVTQATDNCGTVNVTLSRTTFSCSSIGTTSVSVTATDQYGNASTQTAQIQVIDGFGTCPCSYAVLVSETADLRNNILVYGGLGSYGSNGEVCVETSEVDKAKVFVRAANTQLDTQSEPTRIISQTAPQPEPFEENGFGNGDRLKVKSGANETVSENQFGVVVVGRNATLTLSGNTDVYAKKIIIRKGGELLLSQATAVHLNNGLKTGNEATINSDRRRAKFFIEKKVKIGKSNSINGYFYALEDVTFKRNKSDAPTVVNGTVIAKNVTAKAYVTWDGGVINCNTESEPETRIKAQTIATIEPKPEAEEKALMEETLGDFYTFGPNPTAGELTIRFKSELNKIPTVKLTTVLGREVKVKQQPSLINNRTLRLGLAHLQSGVYLLSIQQGLQTQTVKIVKQ